MSDSIMHGHSQLHFCFLTAINGYFYEHSDLDIKCVCAYLYVEIFINNKSTYNSDLIHQPVLIELHEAAVLVD
jgi:hypothetical protein